MILVGTACDEAEKRRQEPMSEQSQHLGESISGMQISRKHGSTTELFKSRGQSFVFVPHRGARLEIARGEVRHRFVRLIQVSGG